MLLVSTTMPHGGQMAPLHAMGEQHLLPQAGSSVLQPCTKTWPTLRSPWLHLLDLFHKSHTEQGAASHKSLQHKPHNGDHLNGVDLATLQLKASEQPEIPWAKQRDKPLCGKYLQDK
jgi:hypothetical protein